MAVTNRAFPGLLSDPQAFTEFYEKALPRVYGYLLARCAGEAWLAEDLTQETFLAAVAEIKRGRLVTGSCGLPGTNSSTTSGGTAATSENSSWSGKRNSSKGTWPARRSRRAARSARCVPFRSPSAPP